MKGKIFHSICGLLAIALIIFMILPGCENDDEGTPPELPPVSTMVMDFSDFQQTGQGTFTAPGALKSEEAAWYWLNAALHVTVWNAIVTAGMAVPVASFVESFNHDPVYQGDKTWIWTYDVTVQDKVYTAELNGILRDTVVRWEMYVSQEGGFSDFMWYYGEGNLEGTRGFWIMYEYQEGASSPNEMLRIDWTREAEAETAGVTYTNIRPGDKENGGYIEYGIIADENYNRFYDIFNKGADNLVNIKWNNETKEGRIKDPAAYGDDEWRCWDESLQDTDCN